MGHMKENLSSGRYDTLEFLSLTKVTCVWKDILMC